jgi:hypothetical protein
MTMQELEFFRKSKMVTDQDIYIFGIYIHIVQIMFFIFPPFPENLNVRQVQHTLPSFHFRYFELINSDKYTNACPTEAKNARFAQTMYGSDKIRSYSLAAKADHYLL